jgi:hypothetical protein
MMRQDNSWIAIGLQCPMAHADVIQVTPRTQNSGRRRHSDCLSFNKDAGSSDSFTSFGIVRPFPEFVQRDKIALPIQPYEVIPITVCPA